MEPVSQSYLALLAEQYPDRVSAAAAICQLEALCRLPRGTEYFFSDLHGEHEAFLHLLRSGAGNVREKLDLALHDSTTPAERDALAQLVYDPERVLPQVLHQPARRQEEAITQLVCLCRETAHKMPLRALHEELSPALRPVTETLLFTYGDDRAAYLAQEIRSLVQTGLTGSVIGELCRIIRQTSAATLYILGDIYDRGPRPDRILDELMHYPHVRLTWGNHDIVWLGAIAGSDLCLCSLLRIALQYNCLDMLEAGYGINLRPLSDFAQEVYGSDPCQRFMPRPLNQVHCDRIDPLTVARMHKAVTILMFKLEGQLIRRRPAYGMDDRLLLQRADPAAGMLHHPAGDVPLADCRFPTVAFDADPYALTPEEAALLELLGRSFRENPRLRAHMDWMISHGAMYAIADDLLLYHGCIPMDADGTFQTLDVDGVPYEGRGLLDALDAAVRRRYSSMVTDDGLDLFWYLWAGARSPLFGRERITSFERYFTTEQALYREPQNAYYTCCNQAAHASAILAAFGLPPEHARIVNGHIPVRRGECPIRANGRLLMIDGGMCRSYQPTTGIAGYTLIRNSTQLLLAEHQSFTAARDDRPAQMPTTLQVVETFPHRVLVEETGLGARYHRRAAELRQLLARYDSPGRTR